MPFSHHKNQAVADTLRNHLTSIYDKTGASNRSALIAFAIKNGLASTS
jgi:DNA-binding CsgD family transcriptional regulator